MPPEPLPWDRKDCFKERKHDRSSESIGSFARWRDSPHHGSRDFSRWGSVDFRRPPGHAKQGGWHLYCEESGHGYVPSRSGDKMLEDESCRPCVSHGDGKYGRSSRENRGSFSQRDWKAHSWEMSNGSPITPGRLLDVSNNDQRSVDDMLSYPSNPPPDFANTWDQLHLKDHHDKMAGVNGLGTGQRCDRENSLGSTDWKPLKWSRSGSLSSRGSGFSHSSSSKSLGGVDSNEAKTEIQLKNATPVQSPSGDAAACVTSAAPSEEMTSRKKPRLGWGEGLAKYEKKKVEGPDVSVNKDGTVFSTSNTEPIHCLVSNLADKSPRLVAFSDCASPATPSSVACSSSPGVEEKSFGKTANVDNEISNLCVSPSPVSQNHLEGFPLNLEQLDVNSIANLGSLLIEWLQSDDPSSVESSFVRSTAMNKLLFCKGEISKTLEVTESEIDLLEIELKSLKAESESIYACPASSSSLPMENNAKSCKEHDAVSNLILRPTPLQVVSSGDTVVERMPLCNGAMQEDHADVKDEDIDSPGTATSKFVEPLSLVKVVSPSDIVKHGDCSGNLDAIQSTNVDVKLLMPGLGGETTAPVSSDVSLLTDGEDISCDSILAFNRECANKSYEVFNKLLPRDQYMTDVSRTANFLSCQNNSLIKEKFVTRKRFLRFKERVISLKFRAFQHLWKEDMRLLSVRKHRAKSHKKFELSLRTTHTGNQKHRSSIRSRFSSPAGNLSLVPTTEIINFTSKLLSDSQVKPYRSALKMPALILDKKEKMVSWFISSNGLVEDPCAVEKERAMINPWMPEEKETFMDKLATYGKDFRKIASFLEHKTTADCVEFYYKNHKSDCFEKTKKLDCSKQAKSFSTNTYLVTSGKKWNREVNAASLDMLGAASVMAAHADDHTRNRPTCAGRFFLGGYSDSKTSWFEDSIMERSSSLDIIGNERETVAADVLAGICGSLSSEAMSSCITSSVDPGEGHREWKCQKVDSVIKRPLTPDVTQVVDYETCSDESCGEMDPADWTDEEKSIFIQAVSSYGKDFAKISRCVRTRSRDQCKVFFSKARKCLGLDVMHPEPRNIGTPVSDDANGGRSDTDDACVVETGSVICGNTSGCKMGEDLPLPIMNMTLDESDPAKAINLQIDLNRSEENNGTGHMNNENFEAVETLVSEACQTENRPEIVVEGDSNITNGLENQSLVHAEKIVAVLASQSESVHAEKIVDVLANQSESVYTEKIADVLANQSESVPAEKILDVLANAEAGRGQMIEQGISVAGSVSVGEAIDPGPSSSDALVENKVVAGDSSEGFRNDLEGQDLLLPESSLSVGCRKFSALQSLSLSDSNISTQYVAQDCYLQKCSSSKPNCSVAELPLLSRKIEQTSDHSRAHSRSLSDTDKPCRNGDVKLFGQILTHPSSIHKSNSSTHENEEQETHTSKLSSKLCNLKFSGHHNADGNSTLVKFDRNNYLGLENLPYKRSYGFWDGNRIQTGFQSLPDSAILLAKYPAAFGNYPTPSSKIEQQPLQSVVKSNERNLNGVSVFPTRELNSSNGVVDYQVYRSRDSTKLQPFTVDMKQRQDILSEMQRRNGFEAVSSLQPQGRGVVGMNVVGRAGILVGGPCTGVSDPVAAIKMHYAKTDQYGGQTGSIIREEESWRGKGDIGR